MNWRNKARLQRLIALLPSEIGYEAYYWIQRHFGALRKPNPINRLAAGIQIAEKLLEHNRTLSGCNYVEIGTGRAISLPLGLWLCGASAGYTVDLNPYLKPELVLSDVRYLAKYSENIIAGLPSCIDGTLFRERLYSLAKVPQDLNAILELLQLTYLAPADAAALDIEPESIDLHLSFAVFEHIPPATVRDILREGDRLLRRDGLFIHCVDFSDHFSHTDQSISSINFLQFNEQEWSRIAGNRYMFHNRLRIDGFLDIFAEFCEVIESSPKIDPRAYQEILEGFPLAPPYSGKDAGILATGSAWIVGSPQPTS